MIFGMEVKSKPTFLPLKFQVSKLSGSIKFEVYMPKNGHFGQFFLGRWKLDISDFHQILQEGNVTCPLSAHRNSAF